MNIDDLPKFLENLKDGETNLQTICIIASIFIVAEELINMKQKIEEEQTKTDYTNTKQTI